MTETTLTPEQTQRAEALRTATSILSGDVAAGLMRPNVIRQVSSLVYAAEWILDGPQDDDSDEDDGGSITGLGNAYIHVDPKVNAWDGSTIRHLNDHPAYADTPPHGDDDE